MFAADVRGNIYTFENNHLIRLATGDRSLSLTAFTDGQLRLTLGGATEGRYQLEWSEDLAAWEPLVVLTNTAGIAQFVESVDPGNRQRFYRARVLSSR